MALAAIGGVALVRIFGSRRTSAQRAALAFALAVASAGTTAILFGATAAPGIWAVAIVFGLCAGAHTVLSDAAQALRVEVTPAPARSGLAEPSLFRDRLAMLPLLMSGGALLTVLGRILVVGVGPAPDEGIAAHLWQLLMAGQVPLIIACVLRWWPRAPWQASRALVAQLGAAAAAMAPIVLLGW